MTVEFAVLGLVGVVLIALLVVARVRGKTSERQVSVFLPLGMLLGVASLGSLAFATYFYLLVDGMNPFQKAMADPRALKEMYGMMTAAFVAAVGGGVVSLLFIVLGWKRSGSAAT